MLPLWVSDVYSEIYFTNRAVVATSLVRSHVVFKFLNYVTDKIVKVVLTTLALMLRCVQTICVSVRERPSAGERESNVTFRT